jgi:uncharacterized protein YdeI (YjbR/CyaY-like superfamily)
MGTFDPRIDAYIAKAPDFARPILTHLREVVHAACPEVRETMKWSSPFFDYHGVMCNMAAFKQHCAFGFWKGALVVGGETAASEGAGQFGRLTSLSDLPSDELLKEYVQRAMRLNEAGEKSPTRGKAATPKAEAVVPDDLAAALRENDAARAGFEGLTPSQRREYVEWLTDAKTEATRAKRLATAVEWIGEGKSRHWKYARP